MGVYGCLYHIDFEILKNRVIYAFKNCDLSDYKTLKKEHNIKFFEDKKILKSNLKFIDADFKHISKNYGFKNTPKKKEAYIKDYYHYVELFEDIFIKECIIKSPIFYIGKSSLKYLFEENINNSLAMEIINELDGNCFWTHCSGGYNEGIRSWIDPYYVNLLYLDIENLKLSEYSKDYNFNDFINFLCSAVNKGFGIVNGGDL
jgi:hypothetical protein